MAHPAAVKYLQRLGVTAIELLPVQQFVQDSSLKSRGLTELLGLQLDRVLRAAQRVLEPGLRRSGTGVQAPRENDARGGDRGDPRRGLQPHGRGQSPGPGLSFKGIDNRAYYRLVAEKRRYYMDYTGTGNTLNMRHPHVLQLIMDSLRYWVLEMNVDGFRFDLAATLARELHDVDRLSSFFDLIQQDPVVSQVKLIAEPWDVGEGGYQVGNFPPLWSEWNGKYRDTVRDFWRGTDQTLAGVRLPPHRQLGSLRGHRAEAIREHQLHHGARWIHAARPRVLQRETQRGERRGEPRRREPQPLMEQRTGRADRRKRGADPARTPPAELPGDADAFARRADAARRRRDRPNPAREQQRLLSGQRDLVVRLADMPIPICCNSSGA